MPRHLDIAIVEDNPHDVMLMKEFLKDSGIGYRLHVLEDGESAINYVHELLQRPDRVPDLMFLDLNLPRRNGHEVLIELRSHAALKDLKVVILTTSENPEDERLALANGADCYLTKPPAFENLWHMLEIIETAWLNIAAIPDSQTDANAQGEPICGSSVSAHSDSHSYPHSDFLSELHPDSLTELRPDSHSGSLSGSLSGSEIEQKTILLIEDNPNDVLIIRELLGMNGACAYSVRTAADLLSAKRQLKLSAFDLIMTDLGLPDARGLEVLEGLREYAAEVPIVIVSGLDDEETARAAISQGVQDYLVKGQIDELNLVRSIRYAIIRFQTEHIARRKVASEQDLLQRLLEGAPVSIARFDKNCRVFTSSTAFKNNFCSSAQSVEGASIKALLPAISGELWDNVITKGVPFSLDGIALQQGACGESKPYDVFGWGALDRDHCVNGGIFIAVDASERLNNDRHRQEFIAELAHDIKNPLIGTNKVLEHMVEGTLGPIEEPHKQLLNEIHQSNDGLLTLLRNVLDVYRFDTSRVELAREIINFEVIAGKAVAALIPMARSHQISLQVKISKPLVDVVGDPVAIQRMLKNLLHNAIKFSKAGGVVSLSVDYHAEQVIINVSDNGTGISALDQEYLFRRFGQGRSKYYKQGAGTGIGLYLCKKIAEAHGGSIDCKSRLGEGTTFGVILPSARLVSAEMRIEGASATDTSK